MSATVFFRRLVNDLPSLTCSATENTKMSRIAIAAATVLSLTAGAALAQTTTETTTTQSTIPSIPPPPPAQVSQTTTERAVDGNGIVTDHTRTVTTGTSVGPYGETTTTRRSVESTTSR
jgi:hypothetical protein